MELWRAKLARAALFATVLAVALAAFFAPGKAVEAGKFALKIEIDGPIGPAFARYIRDALTMASAGRAQLVILRMNTPGGLVTSMREIITDVLASPIHVIGYVSPSGAHADHT